MDILQSMSLTHLTQRRAWWQTPVIMVMNLWVSQKAENLTSWKTISISKGLCSMEFINYLYL